MIQPWSPAVFAADTGLIIDALFGLGLNRPLGSAWIAMIETVDRITNRQSVPVVAIDMPSGIDADAGAVMGVALHATLTVTFTRKKPGLLLLPGRDYAGEVVVQPIGMDADTLNGLNLQQADNHPALWLDALPRFTATQHKYDHGHALVLGGALMTGAARLAARAVQRVGTGLVTIAAPPSATLVYASNLDSALVQPITTADEWRQQAVEARKTALLVGPGAGVSPLLKDMVLAALATGKPCVLDADALTCFADQPETLFRALHPRVVLTPHGGEFTRLFGPQHHISDRLSVVKRMATMVQAVLLLKGADTVIAAPDGRAVINTNAPPWLATAGSGDVLAGILTGFMAQGMDSFDAACAAVWLHGDAAQAFSPGMIAEDLVAALPAALQRLAAKKPILFNAAPTASNHRSRA